MSSASDVRQYAADASGSGQLKCVVIGLGANLGHPEVSFRAALAHLRAVGTVVGGSQLYRSKAVGPPQPDFVNAALHLVDCPFEPLALVQRLLQIEQTLGRVRQTRWGPRNLDLDLLWADEVISHEPAAIVPHPRLKERAFALRPLLDLVPLAHDPLTNTAYQTIFEALGPQDLHRVGGRGWAR